MEEFYDRVSDLLRTSGYTAVELSKKLGKSTRYFESMKMRNSVPRVSDLNQMARLLGTTMEYLWTGKHPSPLAGYSPNSRDRRFDSIIVAPRMGVHVNDDGVVDVEDIEGSSVGVPAQLMSGYCVETLKATVVKGDEMVGSGIVHGDIVVYDYGSVGGNGLYVVRLNTMIAVRRLEFAPTGNTVMIKNDNPEYESIKMNVDSPDFQPLGRVVAHMHRYN